MSQKDPLKERISLLEMGEAQGKLKPEHKAELEKYRASGLAKRLPTAGSGPDMSLETSKARDDARKGLAVIARAEPLLNRVDYLQRTQMNGSGLAGVKEYFPWRTANQQYDSATAALKTALRPATRTPGEGATSDFESKLATQIVPDRWSFDGTNTERIRNLRSFLSSSRAQYSKQLGTLPKAPPSRAQPAQPAGSGGWSITRKK